MRAKEEDLRKRALAVNRWRGVEGGSDEWVRRMIARSDKEREEMRARALSKPKREQTRAMCEAILARGAKRFALAPLGWSFGEELWSIQRTKEKVTLVRGAQKITCTLL